MRIEWWVFTYNKWRLDLVFWNKIGLKIGLIDSLVNTKQVHSCSGNQKAWNIKGVKYQKCEWVLLILNARSRY